MGDARGGVVVVGDDALELEVEEVLRVERALLLHLLRRGRGAVEEDVAAEAEGAGGDQVEREVRLGLFGGGFGRVPAGGGGLWRFC